MHVSNQGQLDYQIGGVELLRSGASCSFISRGIRDSILGRKKHINKNFAGLSRDFLGGGGFFFPTRNDPKKQINKF